MQSARLHASLHAFAADATAALAGAIAAGEEVPFEVVEGGGAGSRPGLFRYQPMTAEFIEGHWESLLRLSSASEAQLALASVADLREYVDTYAEQQRASVSPTQEALRCFLHRVLDRCEGEFELRPDRFEPAYRELHEAAGTQESELAVLALLTGFGVQSDEVELAEGTVLVPLERLEVRPPDPAWRRHDGPATVVALLPRAQEGALEEVLGRLCDLQTAMRLYAPGIALEPLAWVRGQRAAWRALPIPAGGRGDGRVLVSAERLGELRAFASLVARRRPVDGELAWALERFELGLDRGDALSGLTDHLLALRALLEPEGPRSGRLAGRIAALCAAPEQRVAASERVARAISLERALIGGIDAGSDALALAAEIEQHLRALLADVICGHLAPELVELADALLWEQGAPVAEPQPVGEMRISRGTPPRSEDLFGFDDYCATEGEASLLR